MRMDSSTYLYLRSACLSAAMIVFPTNRTIRGTATDEAIVAKIAIRDQGSVFGVSDIGGEKVQVLKKPREGIEGHEGIKGQVLMRG